MRLLEVDDARVFFPVPGGRARLRAVDGVGLAIGAGESVALVGESGCGKTTLAHAMLGLVPLSGGSVRCDGRDIRGMNAAEILRFRRQVQMIFQDPFGSLNPRMSVGSAITEVLRVHGLASGRAEAVTRAAELLASVGLAAEHASRYPHELSGGQRQRVCIARALAAQPALVICDEPVSALDVSVQAQVLNLLRDIRERTGMAYLIIAHDLAVVRYLCDRILVMYLGRLVESAPAEAFFARPLHPYSQALLAAVPDIAKGLRARAERTRLPSLRGDVPSAADAPAGCPFHPRCAHARDICAATVPLPRQAGESRFALCHFADAG